MADNDPIRGSDLPPVPPTARPPVPVNDPAGKHAAVHGPLIGPHGDPIPPTAPGDPLTRAESAAAALPLAAQARALAGEVAALRGAAELLTKRTARNEISIVIGAVGLVADIVLSVIVFVLLHSQSVNTDQLRAQQQQLTAQQAQAETVRHDALCPVYNLILAGRSATARANYPAGPTAYDTFFNTISNGAVALRCGAP